MKFAIATGLLVLAASAGAADAQYYRGPPPRPAYAAAPAYAAPTYVGGCPTGYQPMDGQVCICDQQAVFYGPPGGYGGGGYGGGYPAGGYNVTATMPGVRVSGPPVYVPSGQIYVQGAPIYVQAPPVRVASPQIYLQRPQVIVQPSEVTVEPPTIHVAGCAEGQECEAVNTQVYRGGSR